MSSLPRAASARKVETVSRASGNNLQASASVIGSSSPVLIGCVGAIAVFTARITTSMVHREWLLVVFLSCCKKCDRAVKGWRVGSAF
jgi:hypothetical protein